MTNEEELIVAESKAYRHYKAAQEDAQTALHVLYTERNHPSGNSARLDALLKAWENEDALRIVWRKALNATEFVEP